MTEIKLIEYEEVPSSIITKYKRARSIEFQNPHNQMTYIKIVEESVVDNIPDKANRNHIYIPSSVVPAFPILNPITGVPTGQTLSQQDMLIFLFSLYAYIRNPEFRALNEVDQNTIDLIDN